MSNLPNIWGTGQLLAFSGLDGPTDATRPFVLHTATVPGDLLVRLPAPAAVRFEGMPAPHFSLVLGDALDAGDFRAAFLDCHTLAGEMPAGTRFTVEGRAPGEQPERTAAGMGMSVFAACRGRRWVLLAAPEGDAGAVPERARAALSGDLGVAVARRARYVQQAPAPAGLDPADERLLRKAVSVMKVNVEAPAGRIRRRWTTPDRWPHRHLWLWDSAFHAVGFARVDVAMAQDAVLAMLAQVRDDGMLPHMVPAAGDPSGITQPPVLAWSALEVLDHGGDREWAAECVQLLFRTLEWMRLNRDRNGNALPEWHIEGDPLCRSGESGLDNSPRFDRAVLLDAVDFASFLCSDYRCLAEIAGRLGDAALARACAGHAERIGQAVNALLWCPEEGFYLDRTFEGEFVPVKAVSGFLPLFAGIAGPQQAEALRRHLNDPSTFGAPVPVPSVSLDSGLYCKDMWRGPAWINLNYLILRGLRRYGFAEDARRLQEATLAAVRHWYEREGCLFEYYDSLGITSPHALDRKQRLITGRGMAPISDYHWTAALTAAMLIGE